MALVVFLAVVVVGLAGVVLMVDLNQHKQTLEASIKDASGYDVQIKGDIKLSLAPLGVRVHGIWAKQEASTAAIKEFAVALELLPLLSGEIKVSYLMLKEVEVQIQKEANTPVTPKPAKEQASAKILTFVYQIYIILSNKRRPRCTV